MRLDKCRSLLSFQPRPDLGPVLVQARGREEVMRRSRREGDRIADRWNLMAALADQDHRIEAEFLGERYSLGHRVDRTAGDTGGQQIAEPFLLRAGRQP